MQIEVICMKCQILFSGENKKKKKKKKKKKDFKLSAAENLPRVLSVFNRLGRLPFY